VSVSNSLLKGLQQLHSSTSAAILGTFGTTEDVCTGHDFTRRAIDERFERCGGLATCRPIRIPKRAETNSTGSSPLVCSATGLNEILSNGYLRKPSRDIERNYL
jgi:hypothetical protein